MKILLFGEYSGFFNCLKDGLKALGHEVFLVSEGDGYKNYPSDFRYDTKIGNKLGRFRTPYAVLNLFLHKKYLSGYDIVLFVDPSFVSRHVFLNAPIYRYIIKNNKKVFLSGAGDTSIMIEYWMKSKEKYHEYAFGIVKEQEDNNLIRLYPNNSLKKWEEKLLNTIDGYIPIWYEYAQPFREYDCFKKAIRIPIAWKKFEYVPNRIQDKIVFFHGISSRPLAKGTPLIQEAFARMEKKYGDVAEFICAGGLPFDEYMGIISRANVILDDANSCSIAMNGLFSLAKGKIVMGGAEPEGNFELGIEGVNPVLNLEHDVDQICSQIEYVINHRNQIEEMGAKGRAFVEKYHDSIEIAKEYEQVFFEALND